jgi:predicted DNA-binding transcriptional regulator YafY
MRFLTSHRYEEAEKTLSLDDKVKMLEQAAAKRLQVRIIYLKPNDEKSTRIIIPKEIGQMEYQGKTYMGVRGFCLMRREDRTFRIDRILEMKVADPS